MKGLKGKITEEEEELAFDLRDGAFLMKKFFSDHCTKMKFSIKDFFITKFEENWGFDQTTFTEEILNGKLRFLWSGLIIILTG